MSTEFEQGKVAESVLDNPYWKNFPTGEMSEDACKARRWVDGWVAGYKERNVHAGTYRRN